MIEPGPGNSPLAKAGGNNGSNGKSGMGDAVTQALAYIEERAQQGQLVRMHRLLTELGGISARTATYHCHQQTYGPCRKIGGYWYSEPDEINQSTVMDHIRSQQ